MGASKSRASTKQRATGWLTARAGWLFALCVLLGLGGFFLLRARLPSVKSLKNYAPPQVTKVFSDDGYLVAELGIEDRTVVPFDEIPEFVVKAFLAAEDDQFYEHDGLDYVGILRAFLKNLRPGAPLQGASTITQQLVRNLLIGSEQTYIRKIREMILARDVDQNFTKDEILYLYLNQIYFGSGAYGISEACWTYFGKPLRDIGLAEAAYLAGIPKDPSYRTLLASPKAAKERQVYVLERMAELGWADAEEAERIAAAPLIEPPWPESKRYDGVGAHYVEWARRYLSEKYGDEQVMQGGMRIYLGMKASAQLAAEAALRSGLEDRTRSFGLPVDRLSIPQEVIEEATEMLLARFEARVGNRRLYPGNKRYSYVWDLEDIGADDLESPAAMASRSKLVRIQTGVDAVGLTRWVDDDKGKAWVDLGGAYAVLNLSDHKWAKPFDGKSSGKTPRKMRDILRLGDLVRVRLRGRPKGDFKGKPFATADLLPPSVVEGALVSISPYSRLVQAMVGGYAKSGTGLNRATQSVRQPGSAFKPVVYLSALRAGEITPADLCPDSPVVIHDRYTGKPWKPRNYSGRYDGNLIFRDGLSQSKNTCSAKLIDRLGPEKVVETAELLGIESSMPVNYSLALGTGDLRPLELANAYATIAAQGQYAEPILVRKVVTASGQVLEDHRAFLEQRFDPATTFVLTHMMRGVIEEGTAQRALSLGRPLAGKTGTSQDSRNAWFSGFSPDLVATTWVGFDDNRSMGGATGSSAALPIWVRFMGAVLGGSEPEDFPVPEGVVFAKVDRRTGYVTDDDVHGVELAFVEGTEPDPSRAVLVDPQLIEEE